MDYAEIIDLAANYTDRTIALSADSYAVVLSAFTWLSQSFRWTVNGGTPTAAEVDQIEALIAKVMTELMTNARIGEIVQFIGSTPPNVLPCDGSTYTGADYPELFAVLDAAFISGSDFTVPDLRGRSMIGAGAGASLTARGIGETGGAETHQLSIAEMPAHTHNVAGAASQVDLVDVGAPLPGAVATPVVTSPTGGNGAHNNMQPFLAVNTGVVYR